MASTAAYTYRRVSRLVGLQVGGLGIRAGFSLDLLQAEGGVVKQGHQRRVQDQRTGAWPGQQRRFHGLGFWTGMLHGVEERWDDGH